MFVLTWLAIAATWHIPSGPEAYFIFFSYRDDFIQINFENIPSYLHHNFNKLPTFYINSLGVTYDYNSVMHYTAKAFSNNGKDTIEAVEDNIPIGPEYGLSQLDVLQINILYRCQS